MRLFTSVGFGILSISISALTACASSERTRAESAPSNDATNAMSDASPSPSAPPRDEPKPEAKASSGLAPLGDAGATSSSLQPVKIVTIGMHVAGGPFDEATKEPFKKAVEPHFPEIARCWGKHVPRPPKQADVGVDLLIEAAGGHPKVSNPRSTLGKDAEVQAFVPCVIGVFEAVEFAKLVDRGRTGVSYSLRFTAQ
jgi:hypothetical protein